MSVGLGLLQRLLRDGRSITTLADQDVTEEMFYENELNVYHFIEAHQRAYGQVPRIATVARETGVSFTKFTDEPMGYWIDNVIDRWKTRIILDTSKDMREHANNDRLDDARQSARDLVMRLDLGQQRDRIITLEEASREVIEGHDTRQRQSRMSGVPFGIPYLDQLSDGAQPEDTVAIVGRPGVGKCLGRNTKVLMFDGSIKMAQDIEVEDKIMGPDSRPRVVYSVSTGRQEMFKVTPFRGEAFECNLDHILSLKKSGTDDIIDIPVREYLVSSKKFKHHAKLWRAPVEFREREVPYDPYIIGLYLADGGTTLPTLTICDDEIELYDYSKRYFNEIGYRFTKRDEPGNCTTYGIVFQKGRTSRFYNYIRYVLFHDGSRRLPDTYKINSREVRMQVLAGFLDGDGSVSGTCYEVTTKYPKLAEDIAFLARSLGFCVTVKDSVKTIKKLKFKGVYKRIIISGYTTIIPCKLPHKRCAARKSNRDPLKSGFKIESIGVGVYYGFDISGDRRFLLGDFTVTHNTYILLSMILAAYLTGEVPLVVSLEMSVKQCARRLMALYSNISAHLIRLGRLSYFARSKLVTDLDDLIALTGRAIYFLQGSLISTVEDLAFRVQEIRPTVLYVDGAYLLRTKSRTNSRWERTSETAEVLKMIARNGHIPVIATYQFNKRGLGLDNIGFSDTIAQLASIVCGIQNEEDDSGDEWTAVMHKLFHILKGREGEKGIVRLLYDMQHTAIRQTEVVSGYLTYNDEETQNE